MVHALHPTHLRRSKIITHRGAFPLAAAASMAGSRLVAVTPAATTPAVLIISRLETATFSPMLFSFHALYLYESLFIFFEIIDQILEAGYGRI
jgi:hypothetical protein